MKKYVGLVVAMIVALGGHGVGHAASVTTTLPVSATLQAGCSVQATGINFGTVIAGSAIQQQDATGLVRVTCAGSTNFNIYMGVGTVTVAPPVGAPAPSTRSMRPVANPTGQALFYNIYADAARTVVWGDAGNGNTFPSGSGVAGTNPGAEQTIEVFGRILPSIFPPTVSGSYTDTVLVTMVF